MAISGSARRAMITIGLDPRGLDPGMREARKKLASIGKGGGAMFGAAAGAVGGLVGSVASKAMDFFADTARDVLGVERAMTRFQIAADRTPQQMAGFRRELNQVSRDSGIARDRLLDGAAAYQALTGDSQGAQDSLKLFAAVANASGAEMGDIAATAASLRDNLKIDPKDFQTGFDVLITQGKAGAIELRELSSLMAGVAPSFAAFKGGSGVRGLSELGAALQVTRKGFGSASEAATGMRALMVAIQRNAGKFKGVQVFEKVGGKKQLKNLFDIVDSIGKSKLAKDPTLLTKAFGSDEAKRAYDQLVQNRALLDDIARAGENSNAVARDSAAFLASDAGKIEMAINKAKMALVEAFTPERIERFAAALGKAAAFFADLVGYAEQIANFGVFGDEEQRQLALRGTGGDRATDKTLREHEKTYGLTPGSLGAAPHYVGAFEAARNTATRAQGGVAGAFDVVAIANAVRRGVVEGAAKAPPPVVKISDDTIAKRGAAAPAHRNAPGGQ